MDLKSTDRRALGTALMAVLLGALDLTVIATILPGMVTDLRINAADVDRYVWIVNSYLLAYIVAIPVVGRLSDIVGRKVAFQASLVLFVVGSIICAIATNLPEMVAGRAIQGAGGGALLPVTMAMVGDLLPSGRRASALGLVGAVDTLGWVLGPIWGALLVEIAPGQDPWRWVFIVNVPLAVAAAFAIGRAGGARPTIGKGWMSQLDLPGVLLLAGTLLTLNLGLSAGGELGAPAGGARALGGSRNPVAELVIPLLGVAVVLAVLLVQRQRRAAWPLLPVSLFLDRQFTAAITANFLVGASLIVAMVDIPVITAMLVDQPSVSRVSALMLAPFTLLIALLSFAGGRIVSRVGFRFTASLGLLLVTIGYAALWLGLRDGVLIGMLPGLVVAGAGFGLVFAPIGATAIDAAPAADRGIAAALTLVFRLLGMTIGISMLTAIAVRRLQGLVGSLEEVVQAPGESTTDFLARQTALLYETVLPVSLQVARETFLIAGAIALAGLIPVALFGDRSSSRVAH
ncbi:MAG TPA: MFS transporter [Thermomicrobiales bacterium]|nr:MFS transporter [Thermomicrobiales bacterium]